MNSKTLLTKKRNRTRSKAGLEHDKITNISSPMLEVNGFNIVELYYAESLENKNAPNDDEFQEKNIIELREENSKVPIISENNSEIIDMTKAKAKNIEEYYFSKFGISTIKENCFKCLMTNFLSNELLYFNSRKDLFNYIKYCFVIKNKIIFTDEEILKANKENFMNVTASFLNGWRFFIPKTVCKGCFMEIINMKCLINNLKNIFSDIERDSLCRTNYRNYALFSPRFRAAFRLNKIKSSRRQSRISRCRRNKKKFTNYNNNISKNIKEKKNYNSNVKYDDDKNIIIIDKKIMDKSLLKIIKNNTFLNEQYKKNNYNNILNGNEDNKFNEKNSMNINLINDIDSNFNKEDNTKNESNNILIHGQNNINIINNININSNSIKEIADINFDLINRQTEEILNEIDINFNQHCSCLKKIMSVMRNIDAYANFCNIKLLFIFFYFKDLSKFTDILNNYEVLYKNFMDNLILLNNSFIIFKNSLLKGSEFFNNLLNEIKDNNNNINSKDKNSLIAVIQELKYYIDENHKVLEQSTIQFKNFYYYYYLLYKLNKEMLPSQ